MPLSGPACAAKRATSPAFPSRSLRRGKSTIAVGFATSLSLEPKDLTKLAAAVERPGLHLGVWPQQDRLRVWGITRNLPALCLVLEVILPGLLVVKQSPSEEFGKFINIAVLQGDEIKIIDPQAATGSAYRTPLVRLESQLVKGSEVNVLLQLAVSMRTHGRGGMLLVVPAGSDAWNESILQPNHLCGCTGVLSPRGPDAKRCRGPNQAAGGKML